MSIATLRKKVFVGCRQLGLDEDTRRELQIIATGKASMKDMTEADLKEVVKALENRGFNPSGRKPMADRADLRLIHVLWKKLGEAGALERPGREGLNAFIRSKFGDAWGSVPADVDMLRDHKQIAQVSEALKAWGKRVGINFDWGRS